jgi:Domain of unknown function (DUF4349)
MKRTVIPPFVLLIAVLLTACGGAAAPTLLAPAMEPRAEVQSFASGGAPQPASGAAVANDNAFAIPDTNSTAPGDRLVVRTANLSLVVKDPAATVDQFSKLAESMGGFVVSSNVYQTSYGVDASGQPKLINQANLTIRVPSERLDEALTQIKASALDVRNETVTGQDVTEEYTDLDSQLRNLESAETQLRQIMENATKTEDVLQVFEQLKQVQEQIEVTKGRMAYLQNSSKLSSISLDLVPDVAAEPVQIGPWSPVATVKAALAALIQGLQTLADAAIWAGICVLPIAIVLGIPAYLLIRRWLRRRRKDQAPA